MQQQTKNTILFILSAGLVVVGWLALQIWMKPNNPPQPPPGGEQQAAQNEKPKPAEQPKPNPQQPNPPAAPAAKAVVPTLTVRRKQPFIPFGGDDWFLQGEFDPRGGGIHRLVFNQFEAADELGRPQRVNGLPVRLELITAQDNDLEPSFVMYHYAKGEDRPYDTLGRDEWEVKEHSPGKIVFVYDKLPTFTLTKTYTLEPKDYHLHLRIDVKNKTSGTAWFQYQLLGGHGLPIEGMWYASTQRNAMIGQVDKDGGLYRDLEDLRTISRKLGGDPVPTREGQRIMYGGVAVQYFASMIVVPPPFGPGEGKLWEQPPARITRAQPTVESAYLRGQLVKLDGTEFVVRGDDRVDHRFLMPSPDSDLGVQDQVQDGFSKEVVVRYRIEDVGLVATQVLSGPDAERLFGDDIGVRMVANGVDVKPGETLTDQFDLYNGPVKVRLLAGQGVPMDMVGQYEDWWHLNTLTDYQSPGIPGKISSTIGFTFLIIKCTNVMHFVLDLLHWCLQWMGPWSWGVCILLLTLMVRAAMFPLSRRQSMMSMKMQALAPEIKKLQEKFKEDKQALGMAQMELYRRHGVNPLGSCWVLFLQMPIFLGLYYALQESIHFRLANFLWIENLSAPDMLISWTNKIPWISRPEDFGGFTYLGPYFNLLPVVAVGFMIVQQSMMMPPATDEQQQMQQKMMKYMTIFFGLMFYKVAAGLCLYFIVSSAWGFTERKLLPKRPAPGTLPEPPPGKPGFLQRLMEKAQAAAQGQPTNGTTTTTTAVRTNVANTTQTAGGKQRGKKRGKGGRAGVPANDGERTWLDGLRAWWAEVLKKAEKR